ncbi:MAG: PSD1 and planctomycete cytochrome C domain-containing protein [Verrucomicrobiota bacterium]
MRNVCFILRIFGNNRSRRTWPMWVTALCVTASSLPCASAEATVSFNEQIRPLLNAHCVKCHGGVKEAGNLNLLFRDSALKGGKSGLPTIVPGKPQESELIARLTTTNEDDRMPQKGDSLKREQIELLERWVTEGAPWEEHWAYVPPKKSGRSMNTIVKARLSKEHLAFSPEADRRTLARRTALDLTGLPPTPEEVEVFAKDRARDAYERWIDRLLASPAYGERWASVWLDIARYADSKGYEKDGFRDAWRYRDWLIDALNSDMPYDQFLTEQLAGDLLPSPTEEQLIATAFHRNTPANDEGGTDDEEFRTYAVIDRLNTTFNAVQGTSIGCVQCHGHPYDPFAHREYYQLLAFFNNTADADREDEAPTKRFYARADLTKARTLEQKIAENQRQLDGELKRPDHRAAFEAWLREMRSPENFIPLQDPSVTSTKGRYEVQKDGRILLIGETPTNTSITVEGTPAPGRYQAIVLTTLPDDSLPQHGPGGARNGNFVLTRFHAALFSATGQPETQLEFTNAHATFEQPSWPVAEALKPDRDEKVESKGGWAIAGGAGKPQTATFFLKAPVEIPPGAKLRVTLECENEKWARHVLGSFQLAMSRGLVPPTFAALPQELRDYLEREPKTWTLAERQKIERHFFAGSNTDLAARYRSLEEDRAALAALPTCKLPIMQELTGNEARTTRVFHRGNWMDKDEMVSPITPRILNPWPEDYPHNRLGFAKWLTNGQNPLTARVQVNRVWEQLFGIGLVETLEDFGSQGDKPVYQDLLDELATRFQADLKWSQKALLREIVLSRIYRQSSKAPAALLERDPANRLLARGPRFRLTSEQLRDQALAVSGNLSRKMFGPPVMPYQPPGMWQTPYEGRDWVTSTNEDGERRAIYTFIRRSATYPSFVTFDAPSREFCTVRRIRSNTPLQSLDALNNPVFFEAAQGLAKRMATEGGTDIIAQIKRGLLLATQRPPRPDEIAVLTKLYERVDGNLALVANAILNLDEVLNKN